MPTEFVTISTPYRIFCPVLSVRGEIKKQQLWEGADPDVHPEDKAIGVPLN